MSILAAAILTAAIHADLDLSVLREHHARWGQTLTCGTTTVGYRFHGKPGQMFRYAGDDYEIPAEGWIELIADRRRTTYAIDGKSLPAGIWPRDAFGFRDVLLAKPVAISNICPSAQPRLTVSPKH